jgi:hypothetical protein
MLTPLPHFTVADAVVLFREILAASNMPYYEARNEELDYGVLICVSNPAMKRLLSTAENIPTNQRSLLPCRPVTMNRLAEPAVETGKVGKRDADSMLLGGGESSICQPVAASPNQRCPWKRQGKRSARVAEATGPTPRVHSVVSPLPATKPRSTDLVKPIASPKADFVARNHGELSPDAYRIAITRSIFVDQEVGNGKRKHPMTKADCNLYIAKAMSIAGPVAAQNWKDIIKIWRCNNTLVPRSSVDMISESQDLGLIEAQPVEIRDFIRVWNQVEKSKINQSFQDMTYRLRMTRLHEYYQRINDVYFPDLGSGQTKRAARKRYLFDLCDNRFVGRPLADATQSGIFRDSWEGFKRDFQYAARWHALKTRLNYGVLGLIPSSVVSNSWVQVLSESDFKLWLDTIELVNPTCILIGSRWASILSCAINGSRPDFGRVALEDVSSERLAASPDTTDLFCILAPGESADNRPPLVQAGEDLVDLMPSIEGGEIPTSPFVDNGLDLIYESFNEYETSDHLVFESIFGIDYPVEIDPRNY